MRKYTLRDRHLISVEDVVAIEDDVFPGNGADIAEQIEIDMFRQGGPKWGFSVPILVQIDTLQPYFGAANSSKYVG